MINNEIKANRNTSLVQLSGYSAMLTCYSVQEYKSRSLRIAVQVLFSMQTPQSSAYGVVHVNYVELNAFI